MKQYQKIVFSQASLGSLPQSFSFSLQARRAWQSRFFARLLRRPAPRNDNLFILFLSVMTCIPTFILVGIILLGPVEAHGQSIDRKTLPQESTRDPFLLPSGIHLLSKTGGTLGTRGGTPGMVNRPNEDFMKVKAILISDHTRLALIDRHIVTVGDSIRGERVLEIRTDRVTLGKGDQKRTLLLSQSPIRLTAEERPPHSYSPPQGGSERRGEGE